MLMGDSRALCWLGWSNTTTVVRNVPRDNHNVTGQLSSRLSVPHAMIGERRELPRSFLLDQPITTGSSALLTR